MSDLVAKLGVDSSQFGSGLKKAQGQLSSFSGGISSLMSPGVLAFGGIAAAAAGIGGAIAIGSKGISDFAGSLESARKLDAVFQATGYAAGLTTEQIADFASEMQSLTNFEDDATVGAAAVLAAFTNIQGQTFTDTIESAMDLTTIMGGDLQGNVKLLGKALEDPAEAFGKLAKAGVTFSEAEQKKITAMQKTGNLIGAQEALLQGVQDKFGGAAMAVANPWIQLQNSIGDVSEMIGSALLPGFETVVGWLNTGVTSVGAWGDSFADFGIEVATHLTYVGEVAGIIGSTLMSVVSPAIDAVSSGFTALFETVGLGGVTFDGLRGTVVATLTHASDILDITGERFALFFVSVGMDAMHFFTEVAPAYISWFGDNWKSVISDSAANTLTIFENLGTNIQSGWTALLNFFKTGSIQFNWKPLTEGFISTVGALPNVTPRIMSDIEKNLTESIDTKSSSLANKMSATADEFTSRLGKNREELATKYSTDNKVPKGPLGKGGGGDGKEEKKKDAENTFAGIGSKEAAQIAFRGLQPTKLESLAERQVKATERVAKAVERSGPNLPEGEDIP